MLTWEAWTGSPFLPLFQTCSSWKESVSPMEVPGWGNHSAKPRAQKTVVSQVSMKGKHSFTAGFLLQGRTLDYFKNLTVFAFPGKASKKKNHRQWCKSVCPTSTAQGHRWTHSLELRKVGRFFPVEIPNLTQLIGKTKRTELVNLFT
jgi:hypothetical protein